MGHALSMKTYMHSRTCWALAAAMLAMLCLFGCTATKPNALNDAPKAIAVKPVMATHPVYFDNGSANLSPAEIESLRAFLGEGRLNKIEAVTIDAGGSDLGAARAARVSDALSNLGFTHAIAPMSQPGAAGDSVAVTVERLAALPPACPDWRAPPGPYDSENLPMSNLGCATATNLYLMVADPRDLVSGRMLGPADGDFSDRQIDNYRSGKTDNLSWGPGGGSGGAGSTSGSSSGGSSGQ